MAHKSTLFLDEIGDLPLSAQAKILRAIQDKKIDKVGGQAYVEKKRNKTLVNDNNYTSGNTCPVKTINEIDIEVDVRLICATNVNILDNIKCKPPKFRADLYYRISGFHLRLEPLRNRRDDIPFLIQHFTKEFNNGNSCFTPTSLDIIRNDHEWYGNVRELQSFIQNLINLFPEKIPFTAETTKEALECWKGMHPGTDFLFSEDNKLNKSSSQICKSSFCLSEKKEMKDFLSRFLIAYLDYETNNSKYPTQKEIEPILEPSNKLGWLSSKFTKKKEPKNCKLAKEVIDENSKLDLLKQVAPFKKLF